MERRGRREGRLSLGAGSEVYIELNRATEAGQDISEGSRGINRGRAHRTCSGSARSSQMRDRIR